MHTNIKRADLATPDGDFPYLIRFCSNPFDRNSFDIESFWAESFWLNYRTAAMSEGGIFGPNNNRSIANWHYCLLISASKRNCCFYIYTCSYSEYRSRFPSSKRCAISRDSLFSLQELHMLH